jgi:DNA-binding HxlR family transcriptional regulator
VAAITENLLKRKWSAIILRHINLGINEPHGIAKIEPALSPKVLSERLRTMVRYELITRYSRPIPGSITAYRLTALGKKILEMIDTINTLDQQLRQGRFVHHGNQGDTVDGTILGGESGADTGVAIRRVSGS